MPADRTYLCLAAELAASITGQGQITRVKTPALKRVSTQLNSSEYTPFRCAIVQKLAMTKSLPGGRAWTEEQDSNFCVSWASGLRPSQNPPTKKRYSEGGGGAGAKDRKRAR